MNNTFDAFPFLSFYRSKRNPHAQKSQNEADFQVLERVFLNTFEVGLFEVYEFLYQHCTSDLQFENWLIDLKGRAFYEKKKALFNDWHENKQDVEDDFSDTAILSDEQLSFWEANGYLQLNEFITKEDCDDVVALICTTLGVDLESPATWYPQHEMLQGLMLQLYQGEPIEKIRRNERLFAVFAQLYGTKKLIANTEKVSYNPPETDSFHFMGSALHWDIDFNLGPKYYIQGLVYLNDVPADRGAFSLVPRFHKKIDDVLTEESPEVAIARIKETEKVDYLAGKKGDLILWLEKLPHAATANRSDLPRFVQYVSFLKPII
ncbi:phytanoyl-CoA dioxygenase family protein [Pedobacter xixiisoli]|uniref:Phytanoyl-CoA dioxygenase (PhyH) n=1 Tax=Pedobacter xixiisoli TaxID=1476464 RepID=A0A286A643_9SPHI|nr:phytanoyl-CoA dioxygenase family protein [Pedobacter xixiisoli]SOD17380.1 Phytanoyl-CoA dioxygenase (PhyH) [Pedobacter xixiisoli]